LPKGVSKVERELAGASSEEAFKIWNKQGPIANFTIFVSMSTPIQRDRPCLKAARGVDFRSIDFSWMEEFGGIPLRQ
jgi:hypothetical protein